MSDKKANFKHYFKAAPQDTLYLSKFNPILVESLDQLKSIVESNRGKTVIAVDTETTGLSYVSNNIVGFSFSYDSFEGYYIPLRHLIGTNLPLEETLSFFFNYMYSLDCVLFYNSLFDLFMLEKEGLDVVRVKSFDVGILVYNADIECPIKGLKWATQHYLGRDPQTFDDVIGKNLTFDCLDPLTSTPYAVADSCNTMGIHLKLFPILSKECGAILAIDNRLLHSMLFYMKQYIYIDTKTMRELKVSLDTQRRDLEKEIFGIFGRHFNLDCLPADALIDDVYINDDHYPCMFISDMYDNQIYGNDVKVRTPLDVRNTLVIDSGIKECVELELENGTFICGENHPFLVHSTDGERSGYLFKKAKDINCDLDEIISREDTILLSDIVYALALYVLKEDSYVINR